MFNFNEFKNNENNENYLYEFIYSNDFGQVLLKIKGNPISNFFISSYDYLKSKYTYVDITDNEEYVSYLDSKDAFYIDEMDEDPWDNNKRKIIRIGKFVNKFSDFKYNVQLVEKFVNQFKSVLRESKTFFKIYKGEDISKWYHEDNTELKGKIGKSCMIYERCQEYLELYINNPEKISLLTLFEIGNNKVIGRSLLWELNNGSLFMDRIYVSNEYDINIFKRYAMNNNININSIDDENGISKIYTTLKPRYYESYPYLDILFLYQPETGLITDTIKHCDLSKDVYILDDTFGGYRLYPN